MLQISEIVRKTEEMFDLFNEHFYEGELSRPAITVSPDGGRGAYGWCSINEIWNASGEKYREINLCAEYLDRPIFELTATLLYEMAHLYNLVHGVQDVSNNGYYHNQKFKATAEAHGLHIEKHAKYGWTVTTLAPEAETWIRETLGDDKINASRLPVEGTTKGGSKKSINRPNDFHGHSLSVSDVIVINRTAETKAYYVDSFGFEELPDFVQQRMEMLENNHTRVYPPVYKGTLAQAMEERDVDAYLDSRKLNIDCKKAIEEAIALKFDGLHLEEDAATQVLEQFGEERMTFVMANTLRELSYDGRFSRQNKDWAEHIEIPENINQGKNLNQDYVIESHLAVLDGFIDMASAEIRMQKIEQALDEAEVTITADTRGFEADGHAGT